MKLSNFWYERVIWIPNRENTQHSQKEFIGVKLFFSPSNICFPFTASNFPWKMFHYLDNIYIMHTCIRPDRFHDFMGEWVTHPCRYTKVCARVHKTISMKTHRVYRVFRALAENIIFIRDYYNTHQRREKKMRGNIAKLLCGAHCIENRTFESIATPIWRIKHVYTISSHFSLPFSLDSNARYMVYIAYIYLTASTTNGFYARIEKILFWFEPLNVFYRKNKNIPLSSHSSYACFLDREHI